MTTELQASITIKIESFGAIERQLPQDLTVQCQPDSLVAEVLDKVVQSFPEAYNLLERCACAMGEDIISRQKQLHQDSTLVLLSPVAGG
ncbi:MoaD/ThiS family protein [Acinetobacter sp. ASP199]|uniref:MoaD/ThiS family protein n=1 Tax=unclassified Acinetobacter TaxID=196816 RepID=UPI001F6232A1|nr:MoaD/ThiS family protein [Acinetobacter sp. ASP199]UNT60543.1 MoaD/ThiS family protein [Acinetobacter sp. ASP199]